MPRLSPEAARRLHDRLIAADGAVEFDRAVFDESLASPEAFPSTGGVPTTAGEMLQLRQRIVDEVADVQKKSDSETDLTMGRLLFEASAGIRGEFGQPQVWDFLTLVLLPDLATGRIRSSRTPASRSSFKARLTGGNRRHVLQRLWLRWAVFGPELVESRRIDEDMYAAFLERPALSQRPALSLIAMEKILSEEMNHSAGRAPYREFMKRLRAATGLVALSSDDEYLRVVIDHIYQDTIDAIMRNGSAEGVRAEGPGVQPGARDFSDHELASPSPTQPTARRRPLLLSRLLGGK